VFVFVLPFGIPNLEEAIDDAVRKSPGADMLVDVVIKQGHKGIGLIGFNCYEVHGTAATFAGAPPTTGRVPRAVAPTGAPAGQGPGSPAAPRSTPPGPPAGAAPTTP